VSGVLRVWRGRTDPDKARRYEQLMLTTHLPSIAARRIPGLRRIEFARRATPTQVEFMTVMHFDSMDAVREYAGPEPERAAIAPAAVALLTDPDPTVAHFEILADVAGTPPAP
jgi:hypothetical protein